MKKKSIAKSVLQPSKQSKKSKGYANQIQPNSTASKSKRKHPEITIMDPSALPVFENNKKSWNNDVWVNDENILLMNVE